MPSARRKLKVLFIMDSLEKLDPEMDTSLGLLRELARRSHAVWTCDAGDLSNRNGRVTASARQVWYQAGFDYPLADPEEIDVLRFHLIMVRKEPPFDSTYLYMTHLLEGVAWRVFVSNDPLGIRNTNEKLSIFNFKKWIPETLVAALPERILDFQKRLGASLVIKPLDLKGGEGIFLMKQGDSKDLLTAATGNGTHYVMAQKFLEPEGVPGDKRILILDGKILAAYEKRCAPGEFRANLCLGGTYHPADATSKEKAMTRDLALYFRRQGIHFAGIDVMMDRLLEINVTCPAGLMEAKRLYPERALTEAWADSLESRTKARTG